MIKLLMMIAALATLSACSTECGKYEVVHEAHYNARVSVLIVEPDKLMCIKPATEI
jgi:hypothetical protein